MPQSQERPYERRLFCENLAPNVTWQQLKDFFRNNFTIAFANVIDGEDSVRYGVVEFNTRADALEACMAFNGVLLEGEPIRLRQDRGEFQELQAAAKAGGKRSRPERSRAPVPSKEPEADLEEVQEEEMSYPEEEEEDMVGFEDEAMEGEAMEASEPRPSRGGKGGQLQRGPRVFISNLDYNVSWQALKDHMRQAGNVLFAKIFEGRGGKSTGSGFVEYETEGDAEAAIDTLQDSTLGIRTILLERR